MDPAAGGGSACDRRDERRAGAVAGYLVNRGQVNPDRLYVEGRGESQPRASNATAEGRAQNRRVEIILRPLTN